MDHPESQRAKRERLEAAGIAAPPNLTYVTLDFESDSIRDVLVANGFDASQPAFAACLGVLVYLTEAANDKVFQFVAALPASSEMALTFTEAREREEQQDSAAHEPTLAEKAAGVGEPFRTWMSADTLVSKLRALGFAQIDVLQPEETFARYLRDRRDGLRPPRRASIAAARI